LKLGPKAQKLDDYNAPLEKSFSHLLEDSISPYFNSPLISLETDFNVNTISNVGDAEDPSRFWTSSFLKNGLLNHSCISVFWKTRTQSYQCSFPDKAFTSIKYAFNVQFSSQELDFPFILARLYIVDETTGKAESLDSLSGTIECAMSKEKENYVGSLKVQMSQSLIFHKTKKAYLFEIRFFDPSDVNTSIAFVRSQSFKIYARKPNKPEHEKKRKAEKVKPSKKKKVESSGGIQEFSICLETLLNINRRLDEQEKRIAKEMIKQHFQ